MLEMKCPACGGTMQVEEGRLLRACPYCGAVVVPDAKGCCEFCGSVIQA